MNRAVQSGSSEARTAENVRKTGSRLLKLLTALGRLVSHSLQEVCASGAIMAVNLTWTSRAGHLPSIGIDVWIEVRSSRTMGPDSTGEFLGSRPVRCRRRSSSCNVWPILPDDDALPPDDLAGIIAACERFEADWKAGRPRRIEDEIAAAEEPIRARLFRELLALELELAPRRPSADMNAYLARFPDRADTWSGRSSSPKP